MGWVVRVTLLIEERGGRSEKNSNLEARRRKNSKKKKDLRERSPFQGRNTYSDEENKTDCRDGKTLKSIVD